MILGDLVKRYSWQDVADKLIELYPDQEASLDGYEHVYAELSEMRLGSTELLLRLTVVDDPETDEWIDVGGIRTDSDESYAIEFTPWDEWLAMEIDLDTLVNFTELEILAHSLYEMTFIGYDQSTIHNTLDGLMDDVDKIRDEIELDDIDMT